MGALGKFLCVYGPLLHYNTLFVKQNIFNGEKFVTKAVALKIALWNWFVFYTYYIWFVMIYDPKMSAKFFFH